MGQKHWIRWKALLIDSDVFLSASRTEELSYSVREAMVTSLPVISSDVPQVVNNFEGAGNGFIKFENGNSKDLSIKVKDLLNIAKKLR